MKYIESASRHEDMSPDGKLRLVRDGDGDIIVCIQKGEDYDYISADVEFCTIGMGGGRSPKTFNALLNLMVAMEEDNESI